MVRMFLSMMVVTLFYNSKGLAEETILWQSFHSPPSSIRSGEYTDSGFVDLALAEIIKKLPQYEHETQLTTLARALQNIQDRKNVCHPSLFITPERREFAYFAHPSIISPSNRLVTTRERQSNLNLVEPVEIQTVMESTPMSLALVQGRFYGESVNQLLTHPKLQAENRILTISPEKLETVFNLVGSRKVDATVSYLFEMGYFKERMPEHSEDLVSLRIKGIKPYEVGSIACAKTPWGKEVIDAINTVVLEVRPTETYLKAMTTWWEEDLNELGFKRFYQQQFLTSKVDN